MNYKIVSATISALEKGDTMGERIERIGRIQTDCFLIFSQISSTRTPEKSVWIRPIRPIRSPIVSPFPKAETADKAISES
jgi:hypothetical protein